ncbi:MAG: hypothetical protein MJ009_04605 [Paludibacteraceae bacterium]|nr:hypothetical protein [Paludibacteraceae bacterium]
MKTPYIIILTVLSVLPSAAQNIEGGYKPAPFNTHNYTAGHQKTELLPAKYDSRDYGYITTPRNQVIGGPCWAFATCDATEAYSIKNGKENIYHAPQLLTNCHDGFLWTKTQGGNSNIAAALLARLDGQALEDNIPFAANDSDCPEYNRDDFAAYFLSSYSLPSGEITAIKQCIYEYGAVTAAMYYESKYYDKSTNTYLYTGDEPANHGISLVGWDDEEQVFIAKFNWSGTSRFDNGFLKISYNDTKVMSECFSFQNRVETTEIDTAYYYDKTGMTGWYDYLEQATIKKVSAMSYFTAKEKQKVKYVGTYVIRPCTLTLYVMIGADVYSKQITCPYAGYFTAKIDEEPVVDGQFIIAADYPDFIPIEFEIDGYNKPDFIISDEPQQIIQFNDNPEMEYRVGVDEPFTDMNLCLKAYTQNVGKPTESEEAERVYENPVINGKINAEVWNTASEITIHATDGTPVENLTSDKVVNLEGLYIFVVRYSDGVTKRSLELLY